MRGLNFFIPRQAAEIGKKLFVTEGFVDDCSASYAVFIVANRRGCLHDNLEPCYVFIAKSLKRVWRTINRDKEIASFIQTKIRDFYTKRLGGLELELVLYGNIT